MIYGCTRARRVPAAEALRYARDATRQGWLVWLSECAAESSRQIVVVDNGERRDA
ncbi:hypothetical protein [Salana multivorans]